jgi:protein arginine kinase activator
MTFASSLIDLHKKEGTGARSGRTIVCPECGMTYQEFRIKGRFGCVKCYDAFESGLSPLLEKVHGATEHVGPQERACSISAAVWPRRPGWRCAAIRG